MIKKLLSLFKRLFKKKKRKYVFRHPRPIKFQGELKSKPLRDITDIQSGIAMLQEQIDLVSRITEADRIQNELDEAIG